MSRKPDGTERSGRGTAPPAAGGFGGADTALTRLARPFVPKPFRSTGGMSTSADTMLSINMGRHNIDEELPEDQVNIAGIVDRKVSDRRYLPRKLGNMKYYLHTTPVSETLSLDETQIHKRFVLYESSLNEFLEQIGSMLTGAEKLAEPVTQLAATFIPGGDLVYYGYRAYEDFNEISEEIEKLHEALRKVGADIDFSKSPDENADIIKYMNIPGPADRETIKEFVKQIAISSFNFLVDASTAIPLEVIPGMMALDSAIDLSISGISTAIGSMDPEGGELSENMIKFSELFKQKMELIENKMIEVGESLGISKGTLEKMKILTNYVGNLGMIYRHMSEGVQAVSSSDEPDVLAERRRKRKPKKTQEMSTTAGVAGYTGPLAGPRDPKRFYDTMAKVAGSKYFVDPAKTLKSKP